MVLLSQCNSADDVALQLHHDLKIAMMMCCNMTWKCMQSSICQCSQWKLGQATTHALATEKPCLISCMMQLYLRLFISFLIMDQALARS